MIVYKCILLGFLTAFICGRGALDRNSPLFLHWSFHIWQLGTWRFPIRVFENSHHRLLAICQISSLTILASCQPFSTFKKLGNAFFPVGNICPACSIVASFGWQQISTHCKVKKLYHNWIYLRLFLVVSFFSYLVISNFSYVTFENDNIKDAKNTYCAS